MLAAATMLCGCAASTSEGTTRLRPVAIANVDRALNFALSWPGVGGADGLIGARLIEDGPRTDSMQVAIARAILRTNPRITAIGALQLAGATIRDARAGGLAPAFFAAAMLQESAYDPNAISAAGAIGIAQFMPDTAADAGVNPFDPYDALAGGSKLIGSYRGRYVAMYPDPDAAALAAYNAGPAAVAYYRGVPPYRETIDYIRLIYQRWARIDSYLRHPAEFPPLQWKAPL